MALRDRVFRAPATATLATVATVEGAEDSPSVAKVATVAVATPDFAAGEAALLALVERVARAYRTPQDEIAEMKRLALADKAAAWETFTATAAAEGIR